MASSSNNGYRRYGDGHYDSDEQYSDSYDSDYGNYDSDYGNYDDDYNNESSGSDYSDNSHRRDTCRKKCKCKGYCKCKSRKNDRCKSRKNDRCKRKQKCGPKHCKRKPWPPVRPSKKGDDICVGNIGANDITADLVKAPPEKIHIPGRKFSKLGDALRAMVPPERGGPIGGYHVVLKSGCHVLGTDHNLAITNLILEAERWTPTMGNAYFAGHGHSMRAITKYFNFYDKYVGGLGTYTLEVCKNRITVISQHKRFNPNFDSLCPGDIIYWRNKCGKIKCFKIKKAKCNSIWIDGCIDACKPKLGEGFWVGNDTTIQFCGQRQLILTPGSNLEYRGLHLTMVNNDFNYDNKKLQIITGSSNGVTHMIHSHLEDNLLLYGGASWLTPNIINADLRLPVGSGGAILYPGFINKRARVILDQSLVLFAGGLFMGNDIGLESWGSAAANLIGSTVHDNKIGAKVIGGTFNCPGTLFSSCETGIQARSSGKIISSVTEFDGLAPLAMVACNVAFDFDNKISGESDIVITKNNSRDLLIDGDSFTKLSDYPSGQFQSRASTYFYVENTG